MEAFTRTQVVLFDRQKVPSTSSAPLFPNDDLKTACVAAAWPPLRAFSPPLRVHPSPHLTRSFDTGDAIFVDRDIAGQVLGWVMRQAVGDVPKPLCRLQVGAKRRVFAVVDTSRPAPPGSVVCPAWLLEALGAESGDTVAMEPATARLVDYVKLAPHDPDFLRRFPRGAEYALSTALSEGRVQVLAPPFNDGYAATAVEGGGGGGGEHRPGVAAHFSGQPLPLLVKPTGADCG